MSGWDNNLVVFLVRLLGFQHGHKQMPQLHVGVSMRNQSKTKQEGMNTHQDNTYILNDSKLCTSCSKVWGSKARCLMRPHTQRSRSTSQFLGNTNHAAHSPPMAKPYSAPLMEQPWSKFRIPDCCHGGNTDTREKHVPASNVSSASQAC